MELSMTKSDRMLRIYTRLVQGETLNKKDLAQQFHVTERSVQRDIDALRCYCLEQGLQQDIVYERSAHGYRLEHSDAPALSNGEIFAVCKILLESRSLKRDEMIPILDKLVACCVPERERKAVTDLLANEKYHYLEPHHGRPILENLWEIAQAVQSHRVMEITYQRLKEPSLVHRTVEPVGILFSEYYFYLAAFLRDVDRKTEFANQDDPYPTIYRIDRIRTFQVTEERFSVPYRDRFEEGEFRRRVQFMFGGRLETVTFRYTGPSIEAVLDRLPSAQILKQDGEGWTVRAEVFGPGADMWLKSQGDYVKKLS